MLNNKEFGALIAARRREVGLTQDTFAAMLGITLLLCLQKEDSARE